MANYDGKVVISTALDNSGIEKGVKSISGSLGGLKSVVAGLATAITVAFTTAAVAITKQSTDAYAEYEQLAGGVETLFKESAAKVAAYAEDAFYTAGVSANEYMETVTSFSASLISSVAGDTAKAADTANMALIDMSDNANKMGTAIESVQAAYQGFAKQQYTLLDNLKLGYGGTKTEMERLLKDAEAYSGVKYDIKNLSDVYKAIHAIQEKLGIAGATAEEAEKTITGSANMTKAAWKNVLAAISGGGDLDKAINNLVYSVSKYFSNLVPVVQRALTGVGQIIESIVPQMVQSVASALIKALPNLLNAVYQMIIGLAKGIYQGIVALFTGSEMTSEVTAQLNSVATSAGAAANAEKDLANGITAAGKAAKKSLAGFDELNLLQDKNSGDGASGSVSFSSTSSAVIKSTTEEAAQQSIPWLDVIVEKLNLVKKGFEEAFVADIPQLKQNWNKLANTLIKTFSNPKVSAALSGFQASAATALGSVGGAVASIATSFAVGIVGGVGDAMERLEKFNEVKLTSIIGNVTNIADQVKAISDAAAEIAKVFEGEAFKGIVEFFAMLADVTIMETLDKLTGFISDHFKLMTQPIIDNADKIKEVLDKVFTIINMIIEPAKGLIDKFAENATAYEDSPIHKFFEEMTSFASSNLGGLLDEINEGLDGIIELIGGEIDFEEWFNTYVAPAFFVERWEGLLDNAQTGFETGWEQIKQWWDESALGSWWNENVAPWFTVENWEGLLGNVKTGFETKWAEIQTWWDESALGGLWKSVTEFFGLDEWDSELSNLSDTFETAFTEAANAAIGVLNDMISWINQKLKFDIPKLELHGEELWPSKHVTLAKVPKIPYLAQGAVLPANKPFMAVVGDQRHGTNVEAPLATIQEAVALVMQDYAASNLAGHEATVAVLQEILEAVLGIHIGDDVIAGAVSRYNARMAVVRGGQV